VFDFQEEPLDEVALAVERVVAGYLWGGRSGRDDGERVLFGDGVTQGLGVVTLVAENMVGGQIGDERLGLGVVAGLTGREDEPERIAQGVDDGMDLGGQPAA